MLESILFFLGAAVLFYCLFAGADFGAGILEFFLSKEKKREQQEIISHAMGPIWEANHVWIILAIVTLFNAFPFAFARIVTVFHIPLTLILFGIVARGCAFIFRSYDISEEKPYELYSKVFSFSSLFTSFMIGVTAGGLIYGDDPVEKVNFTEVYIRPWFNFFSISLGLLVCGIFTFLASVYLIGETEDSKLQEEFKKRAQGANLFSIFSGALLFIAAYFTRPNFIERFFNNFISLTSLVLATLLLFPLWRALNRHEILRTRIFAGAQMSLVLFGWFAIQWPVIFGNFTVYNSKASDPVLYYLFIALCFGSVCIFPALFYLLRVFKINRS